MDLRCLSLLAVAILIVPAVPAKSVTVRMPYEGPAVGTYGGLDDCSDPVRSVGIVCVEIPRHANAIDVAVSDASGLITGGAYYLHAADGKTVDLGSFCGRLTTPLTGEEGTIVVRLDAVNGPSACLDQGEADTAPATKGIVALRLR